MNFVILVDTREQKPFDFGNIPIIRKTLDSADYSIKGFTNRLLVERKASPSELLQWMTTGRHRMNRVLDELVDIQFRLVVCEFGYEEFMRFPSKVHVNSREGTIARMQMQGVPILFAGCKELARDATMRFMTMVFERYTSNQWTPTKR